jgi:hypothetical protein
MRWLAILGVLLVACTHPMIDAPSTHPPVLATITPPDPTPSPPPDLDTAESAVQIADLCPDEPDRTGHGCSDHDDILAGDRCPAEPETINDFEDADGCPDADPPHVARLHALAREIKFPNTHRSMAHLTRLDTRAATALREVAEILRTHPHLALEIAAHTDSQSDRGFTRVSVTDRRAEAVRDFLVRAGVDPMHLEANGYGPDVPLASNDTPAGRASNRRVEFVLRILPVLPTPDDPAQ